jgi:hypothetical protein
MAATCKIVVINESRRALAASMCPPARRRGACHRKIVASTE